MIKPLDLAPQFAGKKGQTGTVIGYWSRGQALVHWDGEPLDRHQVVPVENIVNPKNKMTPELYLKKQREWQNRHYGQTEKRRSHK
jgi:hypothetical protein